jgi:hypothetical protein
LARRSGRRVLLFLNDSRGRPISVRPHPAGFLEVGLRRDFLAAPDRVLAEIGNLLAGRPVERRIIGAYLESRPGTGTPDRPLPPPRHDLAAMAERLNSLYLGGRSRAGVLWGRRSRRSRRRSIRFGCYDPGRNLIIMNRELDSAGVPDYFVEFILFHEMLHEVLGIDSRPGRRRSVHGRLFKLMEGTYPDYGRAVAFEKEFCRRLGIF